MAKYTALLLVNSDDEGRTDGIVSRDQRPGEFTINIPVTLFFVLLFFSTFSPCVPPYATAVS